MFTFFHIILTTYTNLLLFYRHRDDHERKKKHKKKKHKERKEKDEPKGKGKSKDGDKDQGEDVRHMNDSKDVISTKEDVTFAKDIFVLSKDTRFDEDYKLLSTLGEGAYGKVSKCENLQNGAIRAVKMLDKKILSPKELKDIASEIQFIRELDHPNIVKMYEEYEDHKYLYIVTENIEGGELFDELIRRKKFSEED